MIKVAIIEDDIEIRENLSLIINGEPDFSCQQAFHKVEEALQPLKAHPPDVLLLDISLSGGMNGIEGARQFRRNGARFEIIMLTVHQEDDIVFDALCAGACGYLTKNTPIQKILDAIREAHSGGAPMSTKIYGQGCVPAVQLLAKCNARINGAKLFGLRPVTTQLEMRSVKSSR